MDSEGLANLACGLGDALAVVDLGGGLRWANPAAERLFGLHLDDLIGSAGFDLIHPDDQELALASLDTMQHTGLGTPVELRVQSVDGWKLVELVGTNLADVPSVDGIALCLRDLTERRRWEVANNETDRFRALVHNAGSILMLLDERGVVESVSAAVTRILGHNQAQVEGHLLEDLVANGDRSRLHRTLCEARTAPRPSTIRVEVKLWHREIETAVPFELTVVNMLDDPTVHGFVVSAHDVSELQAARARFEALVEHSSDAISITSPDGVVSYISPAVTAITQEPAEAILGTKLRDRVFPDDRPKVESAMREIMAEEGSSATYECRVRQRDGSFRHVEITATNQLHEPAIRGIVSNGRDITDRVEATGLLAHQAMHDSLTGLPNRAMLTIRLNQTLARVRRHHRMCAVLYVDLDRFKLVNDTLGHSAGDQLLIEAASRIQAAVRETDTVARLGGDEFVVLCEDIDGIHEAAEMAQRLITMFDRSFRLGDDDPQVGVSIGIAFSADGTEEAEVILANADIAMYRAKNSGRHCYELFDEAMQLWIKTTVALETALRLAVDRNELRLYCQPIVEANTGLIREFEALVRWERPDFGLVAPDGFISTAEETGSIIDIGAWVLDEACQHAAIWTRLWPERRLRVSVNVSSRQLVAGDFADVVSGVLTRSGLDPTLLTLELTESTLIDDPVNVAPLLHELRGMGINLALDDFGTGYSSLTYLRSFPFNVIKIDKSFVRTIGTEHEDAAIAAAVIELAESLGLAVIAEGVETDQQLSVLQQLACHYMQGYLFARPLPIGDATELLQAPNLGIAHRQVRAR